MLSFCYNMVGLTMGELAKFLTMGELGIDFFGTTQL